MTQPGLPILHENSLVTQLPSPVMRNQNIYTLLQRYKVGT